MANPLLADRDTAILTVDPKRPRRCVSLGHEVPGRADRQTGPARVPGPPFRSPWRYFRTLTARAITSAAVTRETADCSIIASLVHLDIGMVSVGLNAVALVNET